MPKRKLSTKGIPVRKRRNTTSKVKGGGKVGAKKTTNKVSEAQFVKMLKDFDKDYEAFNQTYGHIIGQVQQEGGGWRKQVKIYTSGNYLVIYNPRDNKSPRRIEINKKIDVSIKKKKKKYMVVILIPIFLFLIIKL